MPKTKIPAEYISDNPSLSGTDSVKVPAGTTAQRGTGVAGKFRFNTTLNKFEGYTDSWGEIGGSGGSALETDNFTGDDSTTAFTLSSSVSDEDNLIVFIDGVYQNKADYVASGTTLTLDTAPLAGRKIVVYHVRANVSGSNCILNSFSGNGSTTAFTLTQNPASENNTQVFIDGVYQRKDSYSVSGTTLTFDAAPANGTAIEVMMFTQTDINTLPASFVSGLTEVTATGSDHLMVFDATDSSLKKALASDLIETVGSTPTFTSATISGDLTVDTSTLKVDSTNNRVGVGLTSPSVPMHIQDQASSDTTVLRLENKPATAATNAVAMEFWGNEGTANNGVYNIGKIYGHFDGSNYSDTRLTLGSAAANGSFHDELTLKNGKVGIGGIATPSEILQVDCGAPSSSDKTLGLFQSESLRQIGFVWDDSESTLGIATLTNHALDFHVNGNSSSAMTIQTNKLIQVPSMVRAHGWVGSTNTINGHAMEIGRSGSYGYSLSYDRALGQYKGNIVSGYDIRFQTQGNQRIVISDTGHLYPYADNTYDLGLSNQRFDDIYATSGTVNTSDRNEKNTITDTDLGLDFINRLSPKSYKFNGKTRIHYGLIAQDIEDVLEDINKPTSDFAGFIKSQKYRQVGEEVTEEDGIITSEPTQEIVEGEYTYGLRYSEFISPMIKAIQELKVDNDALRARIETLENA